MNVITKSGGNRFSGSFRDTLNNDKWRALTFEAAPASFAGDSKLDKVVPTYEYTFGGPVHARSPVVLHRRPAAERRTSGRNAGRSPASPMPFDRRDDTRYEGKGTYSLTPSHRFQGAYTQARPRAQINDTFNPDRRWTLRSLVHAHLPEDLVHLQLQRRPDPDVLRRGPLLERAARASSNVGAPTSPTSSTARCSSTSARQPPLLVADVLRRLRARRARQRGHLRQGVVLPVDQRRRLAQHDLRLRQLQRQALRQQPPVGQRLPHPRHRRRSSDGATAIYSGVPAATARRSSSGIRSSIEQPGLELPHALRRSSTTRWRVSDRADRQPRRCARTRTTARTRRATSSPTTAR